MKLFTQRRVMLLSAVAAILSITISMMTLSGGFSIVTEQSGVKITTTFSPEPFTIEKDLYGYNSDVENFTITITFKAVDGSTISDSSVIYYYQETIKTLMSGSGGEEVVKSFITSNLAGTHTFVISAKTGASGSYVQQTIVIECTGLTGES